MSSKETITEDLVLIVDLGRIRALRLVRGGDDPQERDHLVEVAVKQMKEIGQPIRETVTDQSGRFGHHGVAGTAGGMSAGEDHNLESELRRKALRSVAEAIAEIVREEGAISWLLAAPKAILAPLEKELSEGCRESLARTMGSDLTKEPLAELERRFGVGQ